MSVDSPIHVLSTMSFPDQWLDRLRAISPRLQIVQHPASAWDEAPPHLWESVEVLYSGAAYPQPTQAPNLRWLQLDTAGADGILQHPLWETDVTITTLSGVGPTTVAEYTMMTILALAHHLPRILDHQRRVDWPTLDERWRLFLPRELRGATLGVIGYGSIGREIGRLGRAFGMTVLGLRLGSSRQASFSLEQIGNPSEAEPQRLYGPDGLYELLAASDYVVLAVPATPATFHLIDEQALRRMRPSSVLINVARGVVVEEQALIRALQERRIAGAALDVAEQEPLPADSPLWAMENVIISPHIAGLTPQYMERIMNLFAANLQRYLAGEPLLNQVQRERRY